jgi:spermidine/putrescine transport system substrate-binding protein
VTYHPRERRPAGGFDRRTFLRGSAAFGVLAAGGASGLLAACGGDDSTGTSSGASPVKLSRPNDPATLALYDDVPAIKDGLQPEKGTLKLFNYAEYINPDTVKAFEKEFGVKVQITTFTTMTEAVEKLRSGAATFDVFFPTPDVIGKVVAGKLLQPLNKSYLPNLKNVWPTLQDPFYDQGSRYSVPYTLYTTGIAFRRDRVKTEPSKLDNGYDILWDEQYAGKTFILNDNREPLGMAMLRRGERDVNTEDAAKIDQARKDLAELADAVNVKLGIEAYTKIPEGVATVHEAWSGDAVNAQYYLPKGGSADVIGYWYPRDKGGVIGSDTMAVTTKAKHPVLAHAFLDFMLQTEHALDNYSWLGYQPPQNSLDPDKLVADEYVPAHLTDAIVRPEDFDKGVQLLQLSRTGETLWDDAWSKFTAGV